MMSFYILILLIMIPVMSSAQLTSSGSFRPSAMYRISDGSEISLPFRLSQLELGYVIGDFDLKTNSALEYRFSNGEYSFDLREAYVVWYPAFGEVSVGKQIHAWGAADGNNPTDNLNAYDYYYLFLPGTDQKIGSLSAGVTAYLGNWQVEAVVTPEHRHDRLPFGEKDFPIGPPLEPKEYVKIANPLEYGVRIQTSLGESDFSLSYFKGHDRGFSLVGMDMQVVGSQPYPVPRFGFRQTNVLGGDFVGFVGDLTVRAEMGYFRTSNNYDEGWAMKFDADAEYLQYVLQGEITGPWDIKISGQWIGSTVLKVNGTTLDLATQVQIELTEGNFVPGMGTPFALFADNGLIASVIANLMDDRLELRATGFKNLEEMGLMAGLVATYSPVENWLLELGVNQFVGDENDPENAFTRLEDFSHVILGLKYSF